MASIPFQPPGYHSVTAYLAVRNAAAAIDFYHRAFGAELVMKLNLPADKIAHAEVKIGDTILMLSDESPEWGNVSPDTVGGSPVSLMIYVPDADTACARALAAGATQLRPVADQFYGDRAGTVKDPFGYTWTLATHFEDVDEAEGQRRMEALFGK